MLNCEYDIDDLNEIYRDLASEIGIENAHKVHGLLGLQQVYLPRKFLSSEAVSRKVIQGFTGYNYKELANQFGVTERHVRNIIQIHKEGMKK